MALGVGNSVIVTARIMEQGTLRRDFGRTLLINRVTTKITDKAQASLIRRVGAYSSAFALAADSPSADILKAGAVYFSQVPHPRNLLIGTIIAVEQPAYIFGQAPEVQALITALGSGVTLELAGHEINTFDFSSTTDIDTVAAEIETKINADSNFAGVVVTVKEGSLIIESPAGSPLGLGFTNSSAARTLGLFGEEVLVLADVEIPETIVTGMVRIESLDCSNYWAVPMPVISKVEDDIKALATWIASRPYHLIFDVFGSATLTASETASIAAIISALQQENVTAIYNGLDIDFKAISYAGRFSSVNFGTPNSVITGKFKQLPSTTPTPLSTPEKDELDRKRVNWYSTAGAGADTAEGKSFRTWIDVRQWIDWFRNAIEVAAYNAISTSGRIPQTADGVASLRDAMISICEEGVINGGIAPNAVSPATRLAIQQATQNPDFDGFLSTGYVVYAGSVAEQSQADRDARRSPPFKIWVKGSGAIHFVDIEVVFEN